MAKSRTSGKRRNGWFLRIVMAAALVAAASWYLLPGYLEQPDDPGQPSVAMVTTVDVHLRAGPGTWSEVLAVVQMGTEVAAGTDSEAGFVPVNVNGVRGWMSAEYLAAPGSVVAQSHTVQFAEALPLESEPTAVPDQSADVAQTYPTAEPTSVPTFAPIVAQSAQVDPDPQPGEKWIDVNRTTRKVTLYNGEIVVAQFDALVGKDPSPDGYYSTATGTFSVHVKEKALVETPFAEGVYLTDFVGFDPERSNGFHSPVRDEYGNVVQTGGTSTLGCVRLSEDDAIFLFNFSHIGMRVEVHD